ncbi:MAG TPA: hypothetical protein VE153_18570 [Myxococcus sp.]|nr:hypothetical protein [Myxococcus sp.]
MNADPMPPCEEQGGFLFSHGCGQPAGARCMRCGKQVCDAHLVMEEGEMLCQTCADGEEGEEGDEGGDGSSTSEDDPSYYYDDYGYYGSGSSWSSGGSRDPNDFTEADGQSLRNEDDAAFEEDLGGS